jgi:WD40 repeat protein/tetratricopeptide (TPR) repeat protein
MKDWQLTVPTETTKNQHSLQRLIRAIALSKGQFALILVKCNYQRLREQMLENLRSITKDINLRELVLEPTISALHGTIMSELFLDVPAVITDSYPSALMVFGLETIIDLEDLLTNINQARDIYAASFPFPIVLWLQDDVATALSRFAPDFKSWAATTIKFEMPKEELISLVRQQTEYLFTKVLEAGVQKFLSNATLDLDPKSQQRHEIESACNDLQRLYNVQLEPELEARLEFVLGRDCYVNDQITEALQHFDHSLKFWQQINGLGVQSVLHHGVVVFHLGLCYRRMADLRPTLNQKHAKEALFWFKQCLEIFESLQRLDLVAKFILPACEMLQRLQVWQELRELAQKSLEIHENYGMKTQVAQHYGFLSMVALSESNWLQAHELVNKALSISEEAIGVTRQQESWYLLLLGRIQRHLGEWEEAVNNLEWAKVVCELQYEPTLYLEIIEELRSLYFFEYHNYLEAFNLKQEKIQIEHQYGFRAFIGASQLQPQRYRINPILESPKIPFVAEEVALEIAASGRQQDMNRLLERISRADCKLTIIHGPSGVGKSSILKAGLVPALKQKVIGDRLPLPIVLSTYSDWVTNIGRCLNQLLAQTDIPLMLDFSPQIIIDKLRLIAERSYTVILILDQFEEFFFVVEDLIRRSEFYNFFTQCLNIPFVKVLLSLREDYLHYLLEFERFSHSLSGGKYDLGVINQNILDKDIRYHLGNFSSQDATSIILSLTKTSHYELSTELIKQLVQDLARENGEVHPIELQIVGAQLQAENITTIEQYNSCGGCQKMVERWLEEVIKDCGRENEHFSWQLLFELTDEKGTRPFKTKADLAVALGINLDTNLNFESTWELILDILIGSGLVLRVREESGVRTATPMDYRYQLVHDYLVEPIRQKNNYGIVAELEKVKVEKLQVEVAHSLSQQQLNLALQRRLQEARIAGITLFLMSASIGGLGWQTHLQKRTAIRQTLRAERSEINLKISAIAAASEALYASNKEFDALLESLRAWRRLKVVDSVQPDTRMRVVTALQQAVYGVTELNRLEAHTDIIWDVAFNSDGRFLASASNDKTVKLWRPDGSLLQTLQGHSDSVTSVTFSPDGRTIASSSLDRTVNLWQLNPITGEFDPQVHKTLQGHTDGVLAVDFSPDGQLLATASKDTTVKLWKNGNLVHILRGHQGWVHCVSFSPDGQLIASVSEDKTIKLWRRDGSLITSLPGHKDGVTFVTFSPDGQLLATASKDKTIKLWRRQKNGTFTPHKNLQQHTNSVWSLSFSSDGKRMASASEDNTIDLWDITEGTVIKTFKGHSDAVASVTFSPDNKYLVSGSYDKTMKIWSLDAPTLPILEGHDDRVLSVAWSRDGKTLASGSRDHKIKLWQREASSTGLVTRLYKTLDGHTDRVPSVAFDPEGQMLASASYDGTVKLWTRDGSLLKTLQGHSNSVMSIAFSPDGKLLVSASKDKTIKLWSRQGKLLSTLVGHQGWVNSVTFSPDSQMIASASDDQTVKLWQRDGSLIKTFSPHDGWVLGVSFSPTDHLIASASWDNTVKLWRQDGTLLKTLLKGYSDSVSAVTFSPNGEMLAAASWDSTVKLWSREGKLIKTLNGHTGAVLGVSFSPDGQTLASASDDNKIILWNLNLNDLLKRGCSWVNNYLKNNRNVDVRDRTLCEEIVTRE